jgi:hypothetical protein
MTIHSSHKRSAIVFVLFLLALSYFLLTLGCQQRSEPAPFFDGLYLKYGEVFSKSSKPEDIIWTREIGYTFKKLEDGNFHVTQGVKTKRGKRLKKELEPIPYPQIGEDLTVDKKGIVLKGGDGMNFINGYLSCLWLPPDKRKEGADLFKIKIMWRVEEKTRWEGWEVWPVKMLTQDDMRYYDVNTGFLVGEEHMRGKWKTILQDTNLDVLKAAIPANVVGNITPVLSPQDVVKQYCHLQAEGYGLSSEGWVKIEPLVAWSDEPGWDTVIVISNYKVGSLEKIGKKALVSVKYFVLGSTDSMRFVKSKRQETIKFELGMIDGKWKITRPLIMPHVNKETVIRHLREIQASETVRREQLESVIQAIIKADK